MRRINLYFGLILSVIFLMTGYYLEEYFKPQHIDNLVLRMEIRANHIYILLISLLNIISFKCYFTTGKKLTNFLEPVFSLLLITAGIFAILAFMYDHHGTLENRDITLATMILSITAVVTFLTNEITYLAGKKKRKI
jgi:hypothetical protein